MAANFDLGEYRMDAPVTNRGMLYHGAYYSGIVGAHLSALPNRQPGAVSSIKPAYDVSLSQDVLRSQLSVPQQAAPVKARAAFHQKAVIGDSQLGPEALVSRVQNTPYNVARAAQAYQATAGM